MKMKWTTLLTSYLTLGAAGLSGQITLVNYTFDSDLSAATTAANISASAVSGMNTGDVSVTRSGGDGTLVADFTPIDNAVSSGPGGRAYGRFWNSDGSGLFQHYFDWDMTVDSDSVLLGNGSFVELDLGSRSEGPSKYAIAYSTDGFSSETFIAGTGLTAADGLDTFVGSDLPDPSNFDWKRVNHTFNAGTIGAGTTVEFRVYLGESALDTGSDGNFYIDNVAVTAVPEPSAYAAIAGLLVLGLAVWRQRG